MVGRPKNPNPSRKVEPRLPVDAYACLKELVKKGYGNSPTDVAKYLILREIDDLKRTRVLNRDRPET